MKETIIHYKFIKLSYLLELELIKRSLVLGFSGGQDSLALLKLLCDYRKTYPSLLKLVYCDHGWRLESIANAQRLYYLSKYSNLYFYYFATSTILSFESQSRIWRYKNLLKISLLFKHSYLLTAHTLSDTSETITYKLIRNLKISDITNLLFAFLYLKKTLSIVRPIANITRNDAYWLCNLSYLPLWSDYTNYWLLLSRNRIRQELLPYLKNYFNCSVERCLNRFIYFNKINLVALNVMLSKILDKTFYYTHHGICINISLFKLLPFFYQYIVIRDFFCLFFRCYCSPFQVNRLLFAIALEKSHKIFIRE
nr:tRNA(Ile)-lysidine synthase [Cyanidiaceae sp.]